MNNHMSEIREPILTENAGRVRSQFVQYAPFCLLRVAALPFGSLMKLRQTETLALVERIRMDRQELEKISRSVEDALHRFVPILGEHEVQLRRAVLNIKRDIHNGRPCKVKPAMYEQIAMRMRGDDKLRFEHWCALQSRIKHNSAEASDRFDEELQTKVRHYLRQPLQNPLFFHGIAVGSPGVARSAAKERRLPTKPVPDNLERSLLGYLIRAAAKTSPFSSFMYQTAVGFHAGSVQAKPSIVAPSIQMRSRLNRGIIKRLHRAYCLACAERGDLPISVNPSLSEYSEGKLQGICNRDIVIIGRPWCDQRYAQFRLDSRIIEVLLNEPKQTTWRSFMQRLQDRGVPQPKCEQIMAKLYARGLLLPPKFTDAFDEKPAQRLLQLVKKYPDPVGIASRLTDNIEAMSEHAQSVGLIDESAGSESVKSVVHSLEKIRYLEAESLKMLNVDGYDELHNMVLEDCWFAGAKGEFSHELAQTLEGLTHFLSTQVALAPEYSRLLEKFTATYGVGGECKQVKEFLLTVGNQLFDIPEYGAKRIARAPTRAKAGTQVGVTAQIQIAKDPVTGESIAVVNRVFNGLGWLSSRFGFGDEKEKLFLRESLSQWLIDSSSPREPVDLVLNGDSNDLQSHPRLTKRVLAWPGEPLNVPEEEQVDVQELSLRHCPETNLLDLYDGEGKPIDLVYLGATFPSPTWGVPYALSILTQPFQLMRPDASAPKDTKSEGKEVVYKPRVQHGNAVLRRASWWIRADYFLCCIKAERGVKKLEQAMDLCERLGLPEVFFAQKIMDREESSIPEDVLSADRKPIWIDAKNPFCLSLLERLAEKGDWLSITEALPDASDNWLNVDADAHVSEIQVELIVRAENVASDAEH